MTGTTRYMLGYAAIIQRPPGRIFLLPELAPPLKQVSSNGATKLDIRSSKLRQPSSSVLDFRYAVETPDTVAARIRKALPHVPRRRSRRAGLRIEIPAARGRLRKMSDGERRSDRPTSFQGERTRPRGPEKSGGHRNRARRAGAATYRNGAPRWGGSAPLCVARGVSTAPCRVRVRRDAPTGLAAHQLQRVSGSMAYAHLSPPGIALRCLDSLPRSAPEQPTLVQLLLDEIG